MIDQGMLYRIIYALAAKDGREQVLFGKSAPLAWEAFRRSLASGDISELWFEVPLLGDPWFDVHVVVAHEGVSPEATFEGDVLGVYTNTLKWFAGAEGVRQLVFSWDTGSGRRDVPGVQLLVKTRDPSVTCDFLEAAGKSEAVRRYRTFRELMPEGWFPCYTGVFPGREDQTLRVECIPDKSLQGPYADDASLLESHLRQVGLTDLGGSLVERCRLLARTPFSLEFQFDIADDGRAGTTFGASLRFGPASIEGEDLPFTAEGPAGDLMRLIESWGLADDRWRLLEDAEFAKRLTHGSQAEEILCYPEFIKLRWRDGVLVDAKAYLDAVAAAVE